MPFILIKSKFDIVLFRLKCIFPPNFQKLAILAHKYKNYNFGLPRMSPFAILILFLPILTIQGPRGMPRV